MLRVLAAFAALAALALGGLGGVARADDDARPPAPAPPAVKTGVVTKPPRLLQAVAPEYPRR